MRRLSSVLAAVAFIAVASAGAAADRPPGADLYKVHCAACHGLEATGNGVMTAQLRHVPPDLTALSKKNGGMFPRARVRRVVEGRDVAAHGERDMPIWGDAFTRLDAGDRADAEGRINAILEYLESIQARPSH